jgi:hypothetical protein
MAEGIVISDAGRSLHPVLHRAGKMLGRVGAASRGILYSLIGIVTLLAAADLHRAVGAKGTLAAIMAFPLGALFIALLASGFAAFAVFHLLVAFFDLDRVGVSVRGLFHRVSALVLAVTYGSLALYAGGLLFIRDSAVHHSVQDDVADVLAIPAGRWAIAAIALGIGIFAGYEFYRSGRSTPDHRLWDDPHPILKAMARIGIAGRAIVFLGIAALLARVTVDDNSKGAGGVGMTLHELQVHPAARPLLVAVGISLVAFGVIDILVSHSPKSEN